MRHRPGSEDVTGAVTWVSVQSALVFWFNKNCASQGPWGRRHRGTRDPARSRARPGERRSVHRSAKMASRGCFGAFVYTVATREGHARVTPPLGWRLCRDSNPHKPPRSPLRRLDNKYRDPSAQGSVAFGSSGASGASRDAPGSLSGPCRTTSTTFSRRTYPAHMRARRTVVETLLSTLNLMNSQNPRWRSVQSLRAMLAPLPCEAPLADSV